MIADPGVTTTASQVYHDTIRPVSYYEGVKVDLVVGSYMVQGNLKIVSHVGI